ncbi:MAG: isochorismatase family protein [Bacteroides sp.]|nr:isochorismatase family protein [Bacteroides sp.]MCM1390996.1 isochorismatase family protein [Bacteroides sp.]
MKENNKMLMIVDPQIDFISGSLPVLGADVAMDALACYIKDCGDAYSHIVVTADRHPMDHCSFKSQGGEWAPHCIHDSVGAAVYPAVMDALCEFKGKITFLHKGESRCKEEYSIFKNEIASGEIAGIVDAEGIDSIDICGIAGDVCVSDSLLDGMDLLGRGKFNVLTRFSPSLDDGKRLNEIISKFGISCDR